MKTNQKTQKAEIQLMNQQLEAAVRQLTQTNKQLHEKADYADRVLMSIDCLTTTQVAKELKLTVTQLTTLLVASGVIYRQCGQWLRAAPYAHLGLAKNRTLTFQDEHGHTRTTTYLVWTELGRSFLHSLFKLSNIFLSVSGIPDSLGFNSLIIPFLLT